MKYFKYLLVTLMLTSFSAEVSSKRVKVPKLYIFGVSHSFKDSVIYMTNIQTLENVWMDSKTKFLVERSSYTHQLKKYFDEQKNIKNRMCLVIFDRSQKKAEKKFLKMQKRYTSPKKGKFDVVYIALEEFTFQPVNIEEDE